MSKPSIKPNPQQATTTASTKTVSMIEGKKPAALELLNRMCERRIQETRDAGFFRFLDPRFPHETVDFGSSEKNNSLQKK